MKQYIFILLTFIISACHQNNPPLTQEINLPIVLNIKEGNEKKIKLSEIADSISYIKLETSETNLISSVLGVNFGKENIYVLTPGRVTCYSRTGEFRYHVNRVGKGPGEGFCRSYCVDESSGDIYVYNNYKRSISKYNHLGEFITEFKDPNLIECYTHNIYYFNNQIIFTIKSTPRVPYFLSSYDIENQQLIYRYNNNYVVSEEMQTRHIGFQNETVSIKKNIDGLYFKEEFCDTIYYCNSFDGIQPKYIVESGTNKLSYRDDILMRTRTKKPDYNGKTTIAKINETSRFLFLRISNYYDMNINFQVAIYDKTNNSLEIQDGLSIENDIDNGLDFATFSFLHPTWSSQDQLYCVLEAYSIVDSSLENIEDNNDSFKAIKEKTSNDDNPIIMLIHLKK